MILSSIMSFSQNEISMETLSSYYVFTIQTQTNFEAAAHQSVRDHKHANDFENQEVTFELFKNSIM